MRVRRATLVVVLTSLRSKANEHVSFLGKELSLGIYFVSILFGWHHNGRSCSERRRPRLPGRY